MRQLFAAFLVIGIFLLVPQSLASQSSAKASGDFKYFFPRISKSTAPSLKVLHSDVVIRNGSQLVAGQIQNDKDSQVERITIRVYFYNPDGTTKTSVRWDSPADSPIPAGGIVDFSVVVPDEVDWPTNTVKVDLYGRI